MLRWQFPHRKKRELQNSQDRNKTNSSKLLYGSAESKETSGPGHTAEMSPTGPGRLQKQN